MQNITRARASREALPTQQEAARELLALTGWEVVFAGAPMLAVLLEVLLEEGGAVEVVTDGKTITLRRASPYRLDVKEVSP
jgi:hypothetical protein